MVDSSLLLYQNKTLKYLSDIQVLLTCHCLNVLSDECAIHFTLCCSGTVHTAQILGTELNKLKI